jgi:hypothetical protein
VFGVVSDQIFPQKMKSEAEIPQSPNSDER